MRARAAAGQSQNSPTTPKTPGNTVRARENVVRIIEPASLVALLRLCGTYMPSADLELIRRAYVVAAEAHQGVSRQSGEPFIEHPVAVASILAELAIDAPGIAAALLHDTVEDTTLTLAAVRAQFGDEIADIVDGVTKFTAVEAAKIPDVASDLADAGERIDERIAQTATPLADAEHAHTPSEHKARQQVETVRKLFLAMIADPRVVLLKLSDRLHNLRTMASMPQAKREQKSRETLDIYAPLAGRMGLQVFKSELEDLAFSYLQPDEYERITRLVAEEAGRRAGWAKRLCERMRRELAAVGIVAAVNWRVKRPYRAYVESQQSGIDVSQLHDLVAFRVLVNTPEQCYAALGHIQHLWHPNREQFTDYIASPKVNGYQSLHTAVFALDGRLAQMHFRTHAMHRSAQHGIATYWLEALATTEHGAASTRGLALWREHMPAWIGRVSHWHDELKLSAADFVDTLRGEMFEDQVFVFTPRGEVRELPAGSSVLDFAYQIHTKVGDSASHAVILTNTADGALEPRVKPLGYVLKTGDVVRIVTASTVVPQPEWEQLVYTRYARDKVVRALGRQRRLGALEPRVRDDGEPTAETEPEASAPLRHPNGKLASVRLARCCYPCPGDEIAGVVAAFGADVVIHRTCCRRLSAIVARRDARGSAEARPLAVLWPEIQPITYRLYLAIYGQDHFGLMHQVSSCVAQMGLNVSGTAARSNQNRYKAAITLVVDVPPDVRRELVFRRLSAVPGVTQVERDRHKNCLDGTGL